MIPAQRPAPQIDYKIDYNHARRRLARNRLTFLAET
jgi:hypothetical protein